jgi:hypothetical protein
VGISEVSQLRQAISGMLMNMELLKIRLTAIILHCFHHNTQIIIHPSNCQFSNNVYTNRHSIPHFSILFIYLYLFFK